MDAVEIRGAVPSHGTDVVDREWDGPREEARVRSGESESYYRRIYAWQDPDGDPEAKASWRFIHHHVGAGGDPGAANLRACITGIGVLNGGRGVAVTEQPWAQDRRGIWDHLARHIRDAGSDPPPLREMDSMQFDPSGRERRSVNFDSLEVRQEDGAPTRIVGYAAVFDQLSAELFGGFRERIRRGAFSKTIKEADIRALFNHDPNYVLGRTRANTLKLSEDDHGLRIEIDPPDTTFAHDLMASISRGDIDQMSFGFRTIRDEWSKDDQDVAMRTLIEVELFDVSPVTFPAYPQTSVAVRDMMRRFEAAPSREGSHSVAMLRRRLELKASPYTWEGK